MAIKSCRKITPVIISRLKNITVENDFYGKRNKHSVTRNFIINSFYFAGFVFPTDKKRTSLCSLAFSILEHVTTLILVIYIVGHIRISFIWLSDSPIGLTLSYILGDLFTLAMRVIIFRKKKVILETIEYLQNVKGSLEKKRAITRRSWMVIGFVLCFLIPVEFFILVTLPLCSEGSEAILSSYLRNGLFGLDTGNHRTNCVLMTIMDFLISNQEYVVPGFLIVLSCYVFVLLQQIIKSFSTVNRNNDFDDVTSMHMEHFQKISLCVQKVEESLSLLLLVIYGFIVFCIYSTSTLLFWEIGVVEPVALLPHMIFGILAITAFYVTAFQAVAVNSAVVKVKNDYYGRVSRMRDSRQIEQCRVLLAIADDLASCTCITGWRLFQFKRRFICQTASAMMTFGFMFAQLGR
ncbi:hypothetical protein JTE90_016648 [Oedothorax gibbosus]|uniref:Odorant receptor n=1 Tax=Oedothorax gibbosus TaxID=931172 RepID=A0AAV6V5Y6_9ARAC|nr:hypothetical protein JTE90_016648 [Oedothorax gibbosus]